MPIFEVRTDEFIDHLKGCSWIARFGFVEEREQPFAMTIRGGAGRAMDTDLEPSVLWIGKDVGFGDEESLEDRSGLRGVDRLVHQERNHGRFGTVGNHPHGIEQALASGQQTVEFLRLR